MRERHEKRSILQQGMSKRELEETQGHLWTTTGKWRFSDVERVIEKSPLRGLYATEKRAMHQQAVNYNILYRKCISQPTERFTENAASMSL